MKKHLEAAAWCGLDTKFALSFAPYRNKPSSAANKGANGWRVGVGRLRYSAVSVTQPGRVDLTGAINECGQGTLAIVNR